MASGDAVMNGDVSRSFESQEETLLQMRVLIQENRNLKEALRQTNLSMKERFEDLINWREKQQEERLLMKTKLEESKAHIEVLEDEKQKMNKKLQEATMLTVSQADSSSHSAEVDALRAQVSRLQAEKNDLVALNSELQLKTDQNSPNESFVEVITVSNDGSGKHPDVGMTASRLDGEDVTVSNLLQSLRNETQRAERLQAELHTTIERIRVMEERTYLNVAVTTQTSLTEDCKNNPESDQVASEFIKSQMKMLFKELQHAQKKLDEAEGMKKNLQDRCREVEHEAAILKAELVDRQAVKTENERLKLQLDSVQTQSLMVQKKAGEERSNLAQLKDAYTKLFEDYNELKEEGGKREAHMVNKELVDDLQGQLSAAEKALAVKQERIDNLKQEMFAKEKELETISVFKAQAEVYMSDFYAEREAREKLHEERERLAVQLEYLRKQNAHMQEELNARGRDSLITMQRRHVANPNPSPTLLARGTDWQQNVCPKCNEMLPDLDSLQIHIMDCIN
ncbi:optineurin [Corythoichthys intestinalis]|uniref:optineurin n=1 Tax=Corythoichthys intestinalis TaxID=161448 RepID=UPI0025A61358|nr:optineurin [Corythoichthys intestinalis]